MTRLLIACAILAIAATANAQTTKKKSPRELAKESRALSVKRADCTRQAKEKKLGLTARRKFVKACVEA